MIAFEKANQIAIEHLMSTSFKINEDWIIEKSFGWFFGIRSKVDDQWGGIGFGSSGFIVDREDGHIFTLGSAYPLERDFEAYQAGFKYESYDLTIISINDFAVTMKYLQKIRLINFEMEETVTMLNPNIGDKDLFIVQNIPAQFTAEQIHTALSSLPYTFSNQNFYFAFETFLEIDKVGCCKYILTEHKEEKL